MRLHSPTPFIVISAFAWTVAATALGCGDGDSASGDCLAMCETPPAAICLDATTLRSWSSSGQCDPADGCDYPAVDTVCPQGCAEGACEAEADPCAGVACDAPPGCHGAQGSCVDGACVYPALTGAACDDGDNCTTGDSCQSGVCVGAPVVCDSPPAAECRDTDTLKVFAAPGSCRDGRCSYPTADTDCPLGCDEGSCTGDPCAGIVCDQPPSECHAAAGACHSGVCVYAVLAGAACDDGQACTASDACDDAGVCGGIPVACLSPPPSTCDDGDTLRVFDATGTCSAGDCGYGSTQVGCSAGCAAGACNGDPCAAVTCDAPPSPCHEAVGTCQDGACLYGFDDGASCDDDDPCTHSDSCTSGICAGDSLGCDDPEPARCVDADTLAVPAAPGACEGGVCSYGVVEVACAFGCADGACEGDPCAGVSCDAPQPPSCIGDTSLLVPDDQGVCSGGGCTYGTTVVTCLHGCEMSTCVAPSGLVISEVLYNSEGFPDLESFIELHGPPGTALDGLSLVAVNGNGGADYVTIALAGNLGSTGLFVVAHPASAAAAVADMLDERVDLQNGPDSVQLRFGAEVLDALAYGVFEGTQVAAGEGTPHLGADVGGSLHRDPAYSDTGDNQADFSAGPPSPGGATPDGSCDAALSPGCECANGTTRGCGSSEGVCELGTETCVDGAWGPCEGATVGGDEVCDGVDDENCDGVVDEGCQCVNGATRDCGTDQGICELGSETCVDGAWGPCEGATVGGDEVCDGVDDENCDGVVDEGCGSDDPFDPGSCIGVAVTEADALELLGGASRTTLASSTIQVRTRGCVDCEWQEPNDWVIRYLTWSGGVTTRWKSLIAHMNLVLYKKNGTTPSLSLQHTTFAGSSYDDDDGMVYGFPPSPITYPHVRAYNHSPENQYDYRELDFQVKDGTLVIGEGCARWTAVPFGQGQGPYNTDYALLFRW